MDPARLERFQRVTSWRGLASLFALLLAMNLVVHRLLSGTWHQEPEDWIAWILGVVFGMVLVKLFAAWLVRRRRARDPSTSSAGIQGPTDGGSS